MAAGERDQQRKKTDARVGNGCVLPRKSTQTTKQETCTRSLRDHTTSVPTKKPRRMTDDRGWVNPMKRQARTEGEVGPEANGSGPRTMNTAESSVEIRSLNLPRSSSPFGTFRWMCRFGGGECREEFQPQVETGAKRRMNDVLREHLFARKCT